jgi:hypothetical protein
MSKVLAWVMRKVSFFPLLCSSSERREMYATTMMEHL